MSLSSLGFKKNSFHFHLLLSFYGNWTVSQPSLLENDPRLCNYNIRCVRHNVEGEVPPKNVNPVISSSLHVHKSQVRCRSAQTVWSFTVKQSKQLKKLET